MRDAAAVGGRYCIDEGTTITLTGGELFVGTELALASLGPTGIGANVVIDAAGSSRVIFVGGSGDLTLNSITVTGGGGVNEGAGIYIDGGRLTTFNDAAISGNTAGQSGGGIYNAGGTVDLTFGASVSDNTATGGGFVPGNGGGISNISGTVRAFGVTISGNTAGVRFNSSNDKGGGIFNAGIPGGIVDLDDTIIAGNTATSGGGIYNLFGSMTTNGSTFVTDNTAESAFDSGGGIFDNTSGGLTGLWSASGNSPNDCVGDPAFLTCSA